MQESITSKLAKLEKEVAELKKQVSANKEKLSINEVKQLISESIDSSVTQDFITKLYRG